jgi:hypothetical protein
LASPWLNARSTRLSQRVVASPEHGTMLPQLCRRRSIVTACYAGIWQLRHRALFPLIYRFTETRMHCTFFTIVACQPGIISPHSKTLMIYCRRFERRKSHYYGPRCFSKTICQGFWSSARLCAKSPRCTPGVPRHPVSPCLLQSRSNFGTSKWVSGVEVGYSSGEAPAVDCRPGAEAFGNEDCDETDAVIPPMRSCDP